jgi:hypothetical protein
VDPVSDNLTDAELSLVVARLGRGSRFIGLFGDGLTALQAEDSAYIATARGPRRLSVTHRAADVILSAMAAPPPVIKSYSVELLLLYLTREERRRSGAFGSLSWCAVETWTKEEEWDLPLTPATRILVGKHTSVLRNNPHAGNVESRRCATIVNDERQINIYSEREAALKAWLSDLIAVLRCQGWNVKIEGDDEDIKALVPPSVYRAASSSAKPSISLQTTATQSASSQLTADSTNHAAANGAGSAATTEDDGDSEVLNVHRQ